MEEELLDEMEGKKKVKKGFKKGKKRIKKVKPWVKYALTQYGGYIHT